MQLEALKWQRNSAFRSSCWAWPPRVGGPGVRQYVAPVMVPLGNPIASVEDSFNAVVVQADPVDEIMMRGRGAGEADGLRRGRRYHRLCARDQPAAVRALYASRARLRRFGRAALARPKNAGSGGCWSTTARA